MVAPLETSPVRSWRASGGHPLGAPQGRGGLRPGVHGHTWPGSAGWAGLREGPSGRLPGTSRDSPGPNISWVARDSAQSSASGSEAAGYGLKQPRREDRDKRTDTERRSRSVRGALVTREGWRGWARGTEARGPRAVGSGRLRPRWPRAGLFGGAYRNLPPGGRRGALPPPTIWRAWPGDPSRRRRLMGRKPEGAQPIAEVGRRAKEAAPPTARVYSALGFPGVGLAGGGRGGRKRLCVTRKGLPAPAVLLFSSRRSPRRRDPRGRMVCEKCERGAVPAGGGRSP